MASSATPFTLAQIEPALACHRCCESAQHQHLPASAPNLSPKDIKKDFTAQFWTGLPTLCNAKGWPRCFSTGMSWVIVGSKHGMTGFDPLQTAVAGLLADHRCGVKGEERVRCSMQGTKLLLL